MTVTLTTSRNGDKKIMQPIRILSIRIWPCDQNKEAGLIQPIQMNIYQNNIYRKRLKMATFWWFQVKDQQSYIPVLVAYQRYPSSSWEHQPTNGNSIPCKTLRSIYSDKNIPRSKKSKNQRFQFPESSFSYRDNVSALIQFRTKTQSHYLERWFIVKNSSLIFIKSFFW